MSTTTTSDPRSESSGKSLSRDSSHSRRHENSVPRSISDLTSKMKTSLLPPLPKKSWEQSYSSFQTSSRLQCPRIHYHPWCDDCQTLTIWEQPLPTEQMCKTSILTFGDLRMVVREKSRCQYLSRNPSASQATIKKVCSTWRDEQFARAVAKRSARMAAREALHWSVHWQCVARGVAPPAT